MGKNQRHKKVLKSEKAKTKLKASKTKFLPKGANVTNVDFKIKPIVILEQLKEHSSGELLTKRKLSLKELLSRLNHYNVNAKAEGCEGLLELLRSNPEEVLQQNLNLLLQGVCRLILDREMKVRRKAITLISEILEKATALRVAPFFDILVSYVSCAMTHIDVNIQEDSLLVVDAFLKHTRSLLVGSFDKILANFLTLISKLRSESNPSRTLTVNLNSKITSIKWRTNVLTRLQGILQAVVEETQSSTEKCTDNSLTVIAENTGCAIPLYKGIKRYPIDVLGNASAGSEDNSMVNYFNVLVPLLHETWAEVVPLNKNAPEGPTIIEVDAASILGCVIGIFYWLNKLTGTSSDTMKDVILSKGNQKFFNHILNQFPYRQKNTMLQRPKKEFLGKNSDPKCVRENLWIVYIFCILYKTFPNSYYEQKAHEIVSYISGCLVNRNYLTSENVKFLTSILRVIFFDNSLTWGRKNINVEELLDNLAHFYKQATLDEDSKVEVFNLLSDLVNVTYLNSSSKYKTWLNELPALLCGPEISQRVIDTLSILSRQNNRLFLDALLKQLPKILDNLPYIKINDPGLYPPHLKIVAMFSYIPEFSEKHFGLLKGFVENNGDSKLSSYVQDLLQEKLR